MSNIPFPVWMGLLVTSIILGLAYFSAIQPISSNGETEVSRWQELIDSPGNELGDALAGVSGSLAFVWLIVTVLLQSKELRLQREELALTREEFKGQRKATEDMARAVAAQADILVDERLSREEQKAGELLNQRLLGFLEVFGSRGGLRVDAKLKSSTHFGDTKLDLYFHDPKSLKLEHTWNAVSKQLSEILKVRRSNEARGANYSDFRDANGNVAHLAKLLQMIQGSIPHLSLVDIQRLENLQFKEVQRVFAELYDPLLSEIEKQANDQEGEVG